MTQVSEDKNLELLVAQFSEMANFDHPNMDEIAKVGQEFGISPLETAKAFFIARERSSLTEVETLDGGNGSETKRVRNYGENSLYDSLFKK